MGKDYYNILGIDKDASDSEITTAYRNMARRYHPDKNDAENAEDQFKLINEAYCILNDKTKKILYDEYGEDGLDDGFVPPQYRMENWGKGEIAAAVVIGAVVLTAAGVSMLVGAVKNSISRRRRRN